MDLAEQLASLSCPRCGGELEAAGNKLVCSACGEGLREGGFFSVIARPSGAAA